MKEFMGVSLFSSMYSHFVWSNTNRPTFPSREMYRRQWEGGQYIMPRAALHESTESIRKAKNLQSLNGRYI